MKHSNITVDAGISKGLRTVNYPVYGLMFSIIAIAIVLYFKELIPNWGLGVALLLVITVPWLYWSVMITNWRLWAFENVRNVHELEAKAIREKLIWPGGHFLGKTEIRSAAQQAKWESLLVKFLVEDEFFDNRSIPAETIIGFSKRKSYGEMSILLLLVAVGVLFMIHGEKFWLGLGFTAFGAWFAFKKFRQANNPKAQITLSEKGIKTVNTGFFEWEYIYNEAVVKEGIGKDAKYYLTYDFPGGTEFLEIEDLDTSDRKLGDLLRVYRGRFRQLDN